MKALVLAAGFGTRLKPVTDSIPKPLVPVNGIPIILYTLALLKKNGIRDVVINLHYHGHKIRKFLGTGKKFGLKISYSLEKEILGTGGGIRKASRLLSDPFLVVNGDVICDLNLKKLIAEQRTQKNAATLVIRHAPDAKKHGLLGHRGKKLVSILGHEATPFKALSFGHFTGLHIIGKTIIGKLSPSRFSCIVQNAYIPHLKAGSRLGAHVIRGFWSDCGTPESLVACEKELNKKIKLSYRKELQDLVDQMPALENVPLPWKS